MCQRFLELEIPIKKALIDLKTQQMTDDEFALLKQIVVILNPIKVTVEALCRSDMNLCKADAALSFMLKEVSKSDCKLSDELVKALLKRIQERRTIYSTLLNFLKNPKLKSEFDNNVEMFVIRNELKTLIAHFKGNEICGSPSNDSDSDLSMIEETNDDSNISIIKKLNNAIEMCRSPNKTPNNVRNGMESNIEKEIELFISGGERGLFLQSAYNNLLTILPTSVDCERCFSSASYIGNKIRSRLSDDTLDALIFLRSFLKNDH